MLKVHRGRKVQAAIVRDTAGIYVLEPSSLSPRQRQPRPLT